MPRVPKLRTDVYNFLLNYFRDRYQNSQALQIRETNKNDIKFPTIKSIIEFVEKSDRYVVKKKGEKSKTTYNVDQSILSPDTIRKAIEKLISDGKIRKIDGSYEYVPHMDRSLEYHPTLKFSEKIDISIGYPDEFMVLTVDPAHIIGVTNYLKALFYKGDIIFIPIADKILCISIYPKNVLFTMPGEESNEFEPINMDLRGRILNALKHFNCHLPDFPYGQKYEYEYYLRHDSKTLNLFKKRFATKIATTNEETIDETTKKSINSYRLISDILDAQYETEHEMEEETKTVNTNANQEAYTSGAIE